MTLLPLDDPRLLETAHGWLSEPGNRQWLEFGDTVEPVSLTTLTVMCRRAQHLVRVFTDEAGRPIGVVALGDIRVVSRTATIWCVLGDKRLGGRGYGTTAMRTCLAHGFQALHLAAINTWVVVGNTRSRRMVERVGFRLVGIQRLCHRMGDIAHDRWLFDLLPEELT